MDTLTKVRLYLMDAIGCFYFCKGQKFKLSEMKSKIAEGQKCLVKDYNIKNILTIMKKNT